MLDTDSCLDARNISGFRNESSIRGYPWFRLLIRFHLKVFSFSETGSAVRMLVSLAAGTWVRPTDDKTVDPVSISAQSISGDFSTVISQWRL